MSHPLTALRAGPLTGKLRVPGDKSISHRSLIFGALATGQTRISGLLESEDVLNTAAALASMGVPIDRVIEDGKPVFVVTGRGVGGLSQPARDLDFGNSGTGARLMMGVVTGHDVTARFVGDESLSRRPMARVLKPLREMGLDTGAPDADRLPLTLKGRARPIPISYRLPVPSAQVKSAILIAGLSAPGETSVIEAEATRDHTERMLAYFGADIRTEAEAEGSGRRITVKGDAVLTGRPVAVPGDPSSAAFLTAAALMVPGSAVTIEGVLINPTRIGLYTTLREMGADIGFANQREEGGEPIADIQVKYSRLHGVVVPAERAPSMIDEYPILSALAAFASGTTHMRGLAELRVKESDRLQAMAEGLTACGVRLEAGPDSLSVVGSANGAVRGGAVIATHLDHRIAMSFLSLGLASEEPVAVDDIAMIATSFPEFIGLMEGLGARYSSHAVPA